MTLTDTHTHLYLEEFANDGDTVVGIAPVERAIAAGVERMIFPNVNFDTIQPMKALASLYPANISMAMGLHPEDVNELWSEETDKVLDELGDGSGYVAVGEIGIDLYWDKTYEREQMLALRRQIGRAVALDLPVIIHCREGLPQTLEVLSEFHDVRAVMHSFGGSNDDVDTIRRVGDYYFGINGIVTFKNCKVRETLQNIGLDRLLLETDSPYLTPAPHRGKRNESAYIVHTAAHIADHLGLSIDQVAAATNNNANRLFGLATNHTTDS